MRLFLLLTFALTFTDTTWAQRSKPAPVACQKVKCAAPPQGCEWTMEVNKIGCITGCGELTCEVLECPPVPDCAAPPSGCNWSMQQDSNGCIIGCGKLICEDSPEVCPPAPGCAAPPQGCNWSMEYDSNKCVIGCGTLVCEPQGGGGYEGPKDGPSILRAIQ